jgi:hypothetical protein
MNSLYKPTALLAILGVVSLVGLAIANNVIADVVQQATSICLEQAGKPQFLCRQEIFQVFRRLLQETARTQRSFLQLDLRMRGRSIELVTSGGLSSKLEQTRQPEANIAGHWSGLLAFGVRMTHLIWIFDKLTSRSGGLCYDSWPSEAQTSATFFATRKHIVMMLYSFEISNKTTTKRRDIILKTSKVSWRQHQVDWSDFRFINDDKARF